MLGIRDADHTESTPDAAVPLITPVACAVPPPYPGAPRLSGGLAIRVVPGTLAHTVLGQERIEEQFTCNYELNPAFQDDLEAGGLRLSGFGPRGEVRIVEIPNHPFFLASLFLPQLSSAPSAPHPMVLAFVSAVLR